MHGLPVAGDRFVGLPKASQSDSQVVIRHGKIGMRDNCLLDKIDRYVVSARADEQAHQAGAGQPDCAAPPGARPDTLSQPQQNCPIGAASWPRLTLGAESSSRLILLVLPDAEVMIFESWAGRAIIFFHHLGLGMRTIGNPTENMPEDRIGRFLSYEASGGSRDTKSNRQRETTHPVLALRVGMLSAVARIENVLRQIFRIKVLAMTIRDLKKCRMHDNLREIRVDRRPFSAKVEVSK